jgi:hypothetical protein
MVTASRVLGTEVGSTAPLFLAGSCPLRSVHQSPPAPSSAPAARASLRNHQTTQGPLAAKSGNSPVRMRDVKLPPSAGGNASSASRA